ncbi:MAG: AMP-binding protein, partial [Solirubrobacteraceae bacterium]|nr:AMP-binding protein [Solirubrobacteraceae bacterium]
MLGTTRLKRLIVGNMEEMAAPDLDPALLKAGARVQVPKDDRHLSFASLLENDGAFEPHAIADPVEAIAVLQYTGGTTGLPKGAMLTHANLSAAVSQAWETTNGGTPPVLLEGQERVLAVLPPFHIYALTANVLFGLRGAAEVILHARFDIEAVLNEIVENQVTAFCGVPTMFSAVINRPGVETLDLRSLKYCGSGGAPLPLEVARQFQRLTGCPLCEGWGMTETSPTGTFTPLHGQRKPGSCGLPMPRIVIKFLDLSDESKYVPLGERGEICIGGPNVMKGYWNKPEATAAVTTFDGLMRTGDVGFMDTDGFVSIVDRCKDMLLCSGYNVYPRVLE